MTKAATARKTDPATDKRSAIVEAAARVFLDQGYGAASMDAIAAEAGVSKQTVYSHFGAKDALFEAIVEDKCAQLLAPVTVPAVPARDPADALAELARRFLAAVLSPPNMALFRVIVAESGRFPEVAEAFYRAGPAVAADELAGHLAALDRAGSLCVPDPAASAKLFFAMLRGDLYIRRLLDLAAAPSPAEIEALVHQAVAAFLAAHTPEK